jgi:hypothetical protein
VRYLKGAGRREMVNDLIAAVLQGSQGRLLREIVKVARPVAKRRPFGRLENRLDGGAGGFRARTAGGVERMREILADSVAQHLVSDVPVGLFLSGGTDSSAVAALANHRRDGALQSFSATFPEDRSSERRYSDLVARRYCRRHTRIRISAEDLAGVLPGALQAMDQPTIDGTNVYTISQAVRQAEIKVVLSGQGDLCPAVLVRAEHGLRLSRTARAHFIPEEDEAEQNLQVELAGQQGVAVE